MGPSDSSDSGSDIQGELHLETDDDFESRAAAISGAGNTDPLSDSDIGGTGERASAVPEHVRDGTDIGPDRIVLSAEEALDSDPDLVSIDDPEGIDIDGLVQDEDDAEEEKPADLPLTSG
ncbi:MAG: chemotaxis protein [Aquabacterium sp.]